MRLIHVHSIYDESRLRCRASHLQHSLKSIILQSDVLDPTVRNLILLLGTREINSIEEVLVENWKTVRVLLMPLSVNALVAGDDAVDSKMENRCSRSDMFMLYNSFLRTIWI